MQVGGLGVAYRLWGSEGFVAVCGHVQAKGPPKRAFQVNIKITDAGMRSSAHPVCSRDAVPSGRGDFADVRPDDAADPDAHAGHGAVVDRDDFAVPDGAAELRNVYLLAGI